MASVNSSSTADLLASSFSSYSSQSSLDTSISSSDSNPLRIFLVQTAKGLFSSSGGYKANLCFLRYLASRGHYVRQICYPYPGEVRAYIEASIRSGRWDPQHSARYFQLRTEDGKAEIQINVDEFVLEDGVQIVALEKEAFDEAFGGMENILNTISKETADYIEVSNLTLRYCFNVSIIPC
jgi:hypothetical protein